MGMEKVDFLWYAKKITASAFAGYMGGIATYILIKYGLAATAVGAAAGVVMPVVSGFLRWGPS